MKELKIRCITIDDYVEKNKLPKVDFIKADIEGAEKSMLRGAVNTMRTMKPKLAICTYHAPKDRKELTKIILQANPEYKIQYSRNKLFAN